MENKFRLFIVDDNDLVRESMKLLIHQQQKELEVCGEAADSQTALNHIAQLKPDVALVDISLDSSEGGLALIKRLKSEASTKAVIAISLHEESAYAEKALDAGADAYMMKLDISENLPAVVRKVLKGEKYVSGKMGKQIEQNYRKRRSSKR